MKDKNSWLKIAVIAASIVGVVVAVATFIKSRAKYLNEELDFDSEAYFDDDEDETLGEGCFDDNDDNADKDLEDDEEKPEEE